MRSFAAVLTWSLMQALEKLKQLDSRRERSLSPAEIVAQRLSMAAAAAANAAAPLANNITSFTSAAASAVPMKAVASQLQVTFFCSQLVVLFCYPLRGLAQHEHVTHTDLVNPVLHCRSQQRLASPQQWQPLPQ